MPSVRSASRELWERRSRNWTPAGSNEDRPGNPLSRKWEWRPRMQYRCEGTASIRNRPSRNQPEPQFPPVPSREESGLENVAEMSISHQAEDFHVAELFFAAGTGNTLINIFDIPGKPTAGTKIPAAGFSIPVRIERCSGIEHEFGWLFSFGSCADLGVVLKCECNVQIHGLPVETVKRGGGGENQQ